MINTAYKQLNSIILNSIFKIRLNSVKKTTKKANICEVPLPDGSCSAVLSCAVLHHLPVVIVMIIIMNIMNIMNLMIIMIIMIIMIM